MAFFDDQMDNQGGGGANTGDLLGLDDWGDSGTGGGADAGLKDDMAGGQEGAYDEAGEGGEYGDGYDEDEDEGDGTDYDFDTNVVALDADQDYDITQSNTTFLDRLGVGNRKDMDYTVTFEHGPIGLDLETDWYGRQACVKGFKKMINGDDGPAKQDGRIQKGDVLVSINGDSCLDMSFQETMAKLREVGGGRHTLHFKALELVAGDLGAYAKDRGISEARRYIHENKVRFFEPPDESEEMIYGCVERHRGAKVTAFNLHREDTGEFLLACSCDSEMTGLFVFHRIQDSHLRTMADIPRSQDSAVYLGCMNPNFMGTGFGVHDHRVGNPQAKNRSIHDLALIIYDSNVLGRVPNFMKIVVPRIADDAEQAVQRKSVAERYATMKKTRRRQSLVSRMKSALGKKKEEDIDPADQLRLDYGAVEMENNAELMMFQTKKPTWNEELCAWTLNFNGRVKQASKKNFLIVAENGNDSMEDEFGDQKIFLRFGKMSKQRFTLDFRYPLAPMVALAVCCTTFAKKLAVT